MVHNISYTFPDSSNQVTIANSGTVSTNIDLTHKTLVGIIMPAAFTGIALTINMSTSLNGTYVPIQSQGSTYSLTCGPNMFIPIENCYITAGARFVQIVSGSAEGGSRTLTLITRPL